jgi:site-specific DNA recombinase
MKNVYAYIRVSTVKQGEKGSSLAEQRLAIESYARKHDLTVTEWFEELETAAKRGRAVFTRMLGLLIKGRASGVIIHKIDRGARNLRDWADLGGLIDRGIELHFAHESLDMQSRGGRLAADIQAVVAADFIRNLRDEVRKGFYGRLRQGIYPLRAPLGYNDAGRGKPKTPDPMMAPHVRHAFNIYATGTYTLYTLGDELHRLGLRNHAGGRVSRNGLSTMLNNEFYIGIIRIRTTGERFQGIHEPLISKRLFDRVQSILSGKIRNTGPKHAFRYRKTLRCSHCAYNLIPERQKGIVYYRCQTLECPRACVREDVIDTQVAAAILNVRMTLEEVQLLAVEFQYLERTKIDNQNDAANGFELAIAKLNAQSDRLTDALIDGSIDKETFESRNRRLLHDRTKLQEQLDDVRNNLSASRERSKDFLERMFAICNKGISANSDEARDLLKSATSNLEVAGKTLLVNWQIPFDTVAERIKSPYCEHSRYAPRTFKRGISLLARRLYDIFRDGSWNGSV